MRNIYLVALVLSGCILAGSPACAAEGKLGVELARRGGKVVIVRVYPDTPARDVGIEPGDILVKVGKKDINSIQDALDAKAAAKDNQDIDFVLETPGGFWTVRARFETGKNYARFKAESPRPRKK